MPKEKEKKTGKNRTIGLSPERTQTKAESMTSKGMASASGKNRALGVFPRKEISRYVLTYIKEYVHTY